MTNVWVNASNRDLNLKNLGESPNMIPWAQKGILRLVAPDMINQSPTPHAVE